MCFSKEFFYLFLYHNSPHKRNIRENVFNYLREIGSKEHKQEHFCPSLLKFKCILFYYILAIFFSFSSIQSLLKLTEIFLWSQCFVGFGAQECWMRSRRGRFSGQKRKMTKPLISVYVAGIKKKLQLYCWYMKQQPNIYYLHIDTIKQLQLHSFSCCTIM